MFFLPLTVRLLILISIVMTQRPVYKRQLSHQLEEYIKTSVAPLNVTLLFFTNSDVTVKSTSSMRNH